jgi:hypothetical protein
VVSTPETSGGLLLAETDIQIRFADGSQSFPCKVYLNLKQDNPLLIEPLQAVTAIYPRPDETRLFKLSIAGVREPIECYTESTSLRLDGVFVKLLPTISNVEVDQSSPLVRVNAGVLNLGPYWTHAPGGCSPFTLAHSDWLFDFTPVTDSTVLYDPAIQNEEYLFTHHLSMSKVGGTPFSCAEAHGQLKDLSELLSFCHGRWVSTALTYGINMQGEVAMEEWGTRQLSPWQRPSSWLDAHHGMCMLELFPGFMQLVAASPDWEAAVHHALYWYIRADTNSVGPDGGCILLQAALERLAWHLLVRERGSLSEDGFSRLPAADQLRLFLSALSIPLNLPSGLTELERAAKELNWCDGPQAFIEIRNRVVHPPKKGHKSRQLPYYDAFRLARWYVELAILSASGYKGLYATGHERSAG